MRELTENLAARGVEIVGGGDGVVVLNLRNLIPANGTVDSAKFELMQILRELQADGVTFEASDPEYILGKGITAHMLGRGIESSLPGLQRILSDIPINEHEIGENVVPIFDRLDEATLYAATDRIPEGANEEMIRRHATYDLYSAGLIDHVDDRYRDFLEPVIEEPPPLPPEFQTSPKPYKSIFDRSSE